MSQTVRGELKAALEKLNSDRDWSFITNQIGMFSVRSPQFSDHHFHKLNAHRA